jgi:hypothetical protein
MHEEQTFVDDFEYKNAVGGGLLKNYKDDSRTTLVGFDLGSGLKGNLKKAVTQSFKDRARLNTLFGRLKYETNSVQRDAIIKEIEALRISLKNAIKDFDKLEEKLSAQLFVDLNRPIKFISLAELTKTKPINLGKFGFNNTKKDIPVNVDAATPKPIIDMGTPSTGSGIVVAPPFDPRNVMVGEFRPVGGGANMPPQDEPSDSDVDETPQMSKPSDEAKPKSKVMTYVLIVAAALGMGYVLFKKK